MGKKKEFWQKRKFWSVICFAVYMTGLVYALFFASAYGRTIARMEYHYNLKPFREISRFFAYRGQLGIMTVLVNLAGNIIGFLPFGFLLPQAEERLDSFITIILLSFQLSAAIEVLQLFTRTGSFDVDDVLLNTLGGATGYLFYRICIRLRRRQDGQNY